MALTFIDGQKNEFFTILNLFKSDDKTVHGLAYTLLSKRLNEMSEQALNHKYIIQFMTELTQYFQTVDNIPAHVNSCINNMFVHVINDSKNFIEQMKREKVKVDSDLKSLRLTNDKLEKQKKQLEEEVESLRKKNAELEENKPQTEGPN